MKKFFKILIIFNFSCLIIMTAIFSLVWIMSYLDNIPGPQIPIYVMFYKLKEMFIFLEITFLCIAIYETKIKNSVF